MTTAATRPVATHPDEHVTVDELASYWRVSKRTLYRNIEKGALPAVRVGPFKRLRIRTIDARTYGCPAEGARPGSDRVLR